MVLSYRVRLQRLKCLSNHVKRWCSQTSGITSSGYITPDRRPRFPENYDVSTYQRPNSKYIAFRSFAAPVQAKPKPEAKDSKGTRLNDAITAPTVRLVIDDGHCIVSRREALHRAKNLKLDLVEVQRHANPPVCKIMDFHKEMYKQQLKEKDRLKTRSEATLRKDIKEVRFTGKIEQKDLQMKADMVKRLMERGYRVKCMAMGKEEEDLGGLLSRLSALIEDVAYVESGPRVERRQAFAVVRHIKFGAPKKNPGKKASSAVGSTNVSKSTDTSKATVCNVNNKGGVCSAMDDEDLSDLEVDQAAQQDDGNEDRVLVQSSDFSTSLGVEKSEDSEKLFSEQKTWSAFGTEASSTVFNFDDNEKILSTIKVDHSLSEGTDVAKLQKNKPPVMSEGNDKADNIVARSVNYAEQHLEDRKPAFESVLPGSKPTKSFERLNTSIGRPNVAVQTKLGSDSVSSSPGNLKPPPQAVETKLGSDSASSSSRNLKPPPTVAERVAERKLGARPVSSPSRSLKPPPQEEAKKTVDPKQGQPLSSYGIFSSPKTMMGDPRASREANNGRQQNPVNLTNPSLGKPASIKNSSAPDADTKQQEVDKSKQGGWGIFSNPGQPKSSDSSTKVTQR